MFDFLPKFLSIEEEGTLVTLSPATPAINFPLKQGTMYIGVYHHFFRPSRLGAYYLNFTVSNNTVNWYLYTGTGTVLEVVDYGNNWSNLSTDYGYLAQFNNSYSSYSWMAIGQ